MAEGLDRDGMLGLLERLGDEDDAVVLSSARELHERVTAAQARWDDLLMPDAAPDDSDLEGPAEDAAATETEADEEPETEGKSGRGGSGKRASQRRMTDAQAMKLINQLLERREISKSLREELQGYKEDIDEGEFDEADRNYLRALQRRLSKR